MAKLPLYLGAFGALIVIFSFLLSEVLFPSAVQSKIKKELRLTRGSNVFQKWSDIETPIFINFYIFSVTNPEQVISGEENPKLEEKGPYSYRQRRKKLDPHSESCKKTVKYHQTTTYFFDEEKSKGNTEDDLVNIMNVPFISIITAVFNRFPAALGTLTEILEAETLVRTGIRVGDLLFEGFDVSNFNQSPLAEQLPASFSDFRFGLYKGKNGTISPPFEVYTGVEDSKTFGVVKKFDDEPILEYWNTDECNNLGVGTDGSLFQPFLEKTTQLTIFGPEICRNIKLAFEEEVEVKGIKGYRFVIPKEEMQGPKDNPKNECYCLKDNPDDCKSGVIDISACSNGAPIALSAPHFLGGFEGYAEAVGLVPNKSLHQTTIDIQPMTGLVLEAHKRLQVNLEVKRIEDAKQMAVIKDTILIPVMWADEEAVICDLDAKEFRLNLVQPMETVKYVEWGGALLGIMLVVGGLASHFMERKKKHVDME